MHLPFSPTIESGTVYAVSGFRADSDGNYLVVDVEHCFRGRSGSTTRLKLQKVRPEYS
jgi:hypothetical protein